MVLISVWNVERPNLINPVVILSSVLTCIIGKSPDIALNVFALASSVIVSVFAVIKFSRTFVINDSSSISTFALDSAYSFSNSSAIALK